MKRLVMSAIARTKRSGGTTAGRIPQLNPRRSRRGFALITTLWLIVAISTVSLEFSLQARDRRRMAINISERGQALAAAEAGVATTQARIGRLVTSILSGQSSSSGRVGEADRSDPLGLADSLFTDSLGLGVGAGSTAMVVRDGGAYLNLMNMSEVRWRDFLIGAGVDYGLAEQIGQAIMDWADIDNDARGRGAEREDYIRAGRMVLPLNRPFSEVSQLRDVMGMTPEIYARIAPYLSLIAGQQININKADPVVLRSLPGVTDEVVSAILSQRYSGIRIRTIEELQRLVPGASNNQFNESQPGELPLSALVTFNTREILVTSIGWSVGGHTRMVMEALLRMQSVSSGPTQINIAARRIW